MKVVLFSETMVTTYQNALCLSPEEHYEEPVLVF
jgi:hypothetical protein